MLLTLHADMLVDIVPYHGGQGDKVQHQEHLEDIILQSIYHND